MKEMTRRSFLAKSGLVALGLFALESTLAGGDLISNLTVDDEKDSYGPLIKDPEKIIDLPKGFSYRIISRAGERMSDGFYVPAYFDGMATFPGPDGLTFLMRNHEVWGELPASRGAFGDKNQLMRKLERDLIYDRGIGGTTCLGAVTTIVYDARSQKVKSQFLSLAGTLAMCGGGVTSWNTWIACEEEFQSAGRKYARDHGYVFEVKPTVEPGITKPLPLKAMGRFIHEGVTIALQKSIIYQTEDQKDSLFYRFIPHRPKHLAEGGRLQCLAAIDRPRFDTRNWDKQRVSPGESLPVHWIDLDAVDSDRDDLRYRGYKQGAAIFARGEGICYSKGAVYFDCTIGGQTGTGQIWRYFLSAYEGTSREEELPGKLELCIEPNDKKIMEHPDQLTVAPWGDLLVCEDGRGEQFMLGITLQKRIYRFARNAMNESEFSGVCFSPDGSTMFLNILNPGITFAIAGPWKK